MMTESPVSASIIREPEAEEVDLLSRLEDFFAAPELTGAISDFAAAHAAEIVP